MMEPLQLSQTVMDEYSARILMGTFERPVSALELSRRFGIPIAACYRRIKELEGVGAVPCAEGSCHGDLDRGVRTARAIPVARSGDPRGAVLRGSLGHRRGARGCPHLWPESGQRARDGSLRGHAREAPKGRGEISARPVPRPCTLSLPRKVVKRLALDLRAATAANAPRCGRPTHIGPP